MKIYRILVALVVLSLPLFGQETKDAAPKGGATSIFTVSDGSTLRKAEWSFADYLPQDKTLDSKLMGRNMPYQVVLPSGYTKSSDEDIKFPVIYLLHGLTGHFNNWTDKTKVIEYAEKYRVILVFPEGGDGWYTDSVSNEKEKYESYIIKELIPEIEKNYRVDKRREARAIAGLSMGGYGSLKFGLKYPDMFVIAGSFSGALGAAEITEKNFPGSIGKSIDAIFGPADSDTRRANDIFDIVRKTTPEKIKTLPYFYIDCGTEDFLFQTNRDFISLLTEKKIPHEYRQLPGTHNWQYWDSQVKEFFRVASQKLSNGKELACADNPAHFCGGGETTLGRPISIEEIKALPPRP
ncbi:MAG: esterase family protein [Acidobacteria bacterium]|nr:esterase family protein [Acidobacteriota bacterium]